jgi:hypothetical protein
MKTFLLIAATLCLSYRSLAQAKMIMTVKDQKCDVMGYAMDPDGTGNKNSISLFGAMQNVQATLHLSYASGGPISIIDIVISGSGGSSDSRMELKNVTVYAIKEYISTYSNGIFNVTASPIVNTEIKCKFEFMLIQQNSSGTQVNDKKNMNEETLSSSAGQMWDIQMDSGLTGATGQLVLQMPTNISYAHLKVFKSGDAKVVASLFGNSKSKLSPGKYDLMIEKYSIKNVPIEVGKTTRLKTGILNYSPRGSVRIVDSNKQEFSMAGPFKIALPPGTYYIDGKKDHAFIIKDGEVTEY